MGSNINALNHKVGIDGHRDWSFSLFDCTDKCSLCMSSESVKKFLTWMNRDHDPWQVAVASGVFAWSPKIYSTSTIRATAELLSSVGVKDITRTASFMPA